MMKRYSKYFVGTINNTLAIKKLKAVEQTLKQELKFFMENCICNNNIL